MAAPRGLSQPPTSFIGFWRQGIHRVPFLTWQHQDNHTAHPTHPNPHQTPTETTPTGMTPQDPARNSGQVGHRCSRSLCSSQPANQPPAARQLETTHHPCTPEQEDKELAGGPARKPSPAVLAGCHHQPTISGLLLAAAPTLTAGDAPWELNSVRGHPPDPTPLPTHHPRRTPKLPAPGW